MANQHSYRIEAMQGYLSSFLLMSFLLISHFAFCQSSNSINDQLFEASRAGDADRVKKLFQDGIDIDSEDKFGRTALFYAVGGNHIELTELLIFSGVDVHHRSKGGITALRAVNWGNNSESLQLLLDKGTEINAKDDYGKTALFHASDFCNTPVIKLFINHGANLKDTDGSGENALAQCLRAPPFGRQNLLTAIETLVMSGVDVNQKGRYSLSPAATAFHSGNLDVIRLIAPKVQGKFWNGAEEDFRKALNNPELVQLYIDAGADVNVGHELGWNLLIDAVRTGSTQSVQSLVNAGADVNSTERYGATPIQVAVSRGDAEMARVLISAGAKVEDVKNEFLKSALLTGNFDTANVLEDAGAYIENQKELTLKGQIHNSIQTGHPIVAEEFFRILEKEFPDVDRKAEIFRLGDLYLREALYNESINLYQQVIQNYPGSLSVPLAYYQIAQAYKKLGLESNMAKALEDSLSYSVTKEDSINFEVSGMYGEPRAELARYYMKIGNWSGALEHWQQWQPSNDCLGTEREERRRMIVECQSHLQPQE